MEKGRNEITFILTKNIGQSSKSHLFLNYFYRAKVIGQAMNLKFKEDRSCKERRDANITLLETDVTEQVVKMIQLKFLRI